MLRSNASRLIHGLAPRARRIALAALAAGLLAASAMASPPPGADAEPHDPLLLVPAPRQVEMKPGRASLPARWALVTTGDPSDSLAAAGVAAEIGALLGRPVTMAPGSAAAPALSFAWVPPNAAAPRLFHEQGYRLTVAPDRIRIEGASPAGRFHGAQTLRQLIRGSRDGTLPCLTIVDWPELEWRGVSDDISRGQMSTQADFFEIIHRLAGYKMNLYQPYIEDAFAFRSAPEIGRGRARLTGRELRAIVEEGKRYHVRVAPIFETLGHQERVLSIPAYRQHAELGEPERHGFDALAWSVRRALEQFAALVTNNPPDPPRVPTTFSAVSRASRAFVVRLMDEIAAAAPGPWFHIGGDEAKELGEGASRAAASTFGAGRVYARYCAALIDHLRARGGRRAMLFSDAMLEDSTALAGIPRDAIIVDWNYHPEEHHPGIRELHAAGFRDVIVSPGLWNWDAIYPDYDRAFRNILAMTGQGKREGALGCVVASWGDGGAESFRENNWPGYAFAASAAWEADPPPTASFLERFVATEFGAPSAGLARALRLVGWQRFDGRMSASRLGHRAPRLRSHRPEWILRMDALRSDMRTAGEAIVAARPRVRFHADELSALALCASRYRTSAERELAMDALAGGPAVRIAGTGRIGAADATTLLESVRASAPGIRARYQALWLRHNRPEGLDVNLARLDEERRANEALSLSSPDR